ncbi:NAD(P)H-dependent flavin oxidoreductase [Ferrovibrio sp.]|uniref:NAD(P)H-dependent flavin oxidoreductase n=1 Tax=Ferrovibrio sp. TaxID=1917215 RepID=UPI0035AFD25D
MSRFETPFVQRLRLLHPLVQAPMAGETATVELTLAASRAGALGSLGAAYFTPQRLRDSIRALKAGTERAFAVNLFIPVPWSRDPMREAAYAAEIAKAHATLKLPPPEPPQAFEENFDAQIAVVLEEAPPVFSCTFGAPDAALVKALQARDIYVIGTATHPAEARELERRGVDAILAQGAEAGGHRGTFLKPFEQAMIGSMALVPLLVDAVRLPVIAAGGIGDGRGVAAALCLGAQAAALGSSFLLAQECGTSAAYRAALQSVNNTGGDLETAITRAFSGRPARGLRNRFLEQIEGRENLLPDYPIPNAWSRPMRQAAAKQSDAEYLSLWAGQAAKLARSEKAAEIIARVMQQAHACF